MKKLAVEILVAAGTAALVKIVETIMEDQKKTAQK